MSVIAADRRASRLAERPGGAEREPVPFERSSSEDERWSGHRLAAEHRLAATQVGGGGGGGSGGRWWWQVVVAGRVVDGNVQRSEMYLVIFYHNTLI